MFRAWVSLGNLVKFIILIPISFSKYSRLFKSYIYKLLVRETVVKEVVPKVWFFGPLISSSPDLLGKQVLSPFPDPLNQKFWSWSPATWVFQALQVMLMLTVLWIQNGSRGSHLTQGNLGWKIELVHLHLLAWQTWLLFYLPVYFWVAMLIYNPCNPRDADL